MMLFKVPIIIVDFHDMIRNCSNVKRRMTELNSKLRNQTKRTMVTTSSENEGSRSESEDKKPTNLCLIAEESLKENDESQKVTLEYLLTFS